MGKERSWRGMQGKVGCKEKKSYVRRKKYEEEAQGVVATRGM